MKRQAQALPDEAENQAAAERHPFSAAVEHWYELHRRDLPWRGISDPYRIWISEIILQQTRVVQGYDYYLRFLRRFPDVFALAAASEDEVLQQWQGLGYYSRARNLHAAARAIATAGAFPNTYDGVRALKGVGDYTAAAICSFAYGLPHAVVDGNVYRVLARHFGLATPIDTPAGKREFAALADLLLDRSAPGLHNQALMDFGAVQCTPRSPDCNACPLAGSCAALKEGRISELPVKAKRTVVRSRHFAYIHMRLPDGSTYLRRRPAGDIWQGLYEPLLLEFDHQPGATEVLAQPAVASFAAGAAFRLLRSGVKHVLTHRCILADFYLAQLPAPIEMEGYVLVPPEERRRYAVPRLVELLYEAADAED